uniref:Uncharacterized protein n=1 Tax=Solanum lycopersicum TaxID=4081 RepID=A0A494GA71_SOLLC
MGTTNINKQPPLSKRTWKSIIHNILLCDSSNTYQTTLMMNCITIETLVHI